MRIQSWLFSIVTLLMLAGCSSYSIVSDYDSSIRFGNYRNYNWAPVSAVKTGDDVLVKNPLVYKHIKKAVDRELAAKGFAMQEGRPGDFSVSIHAGIRERVAVGPPQAGLIYRPGYYRGRHWGGYTVGYDPYGAYPNLTFYEEGTLIIDIIDTRSGDLAWRGVARGILKHYDSSEELHKELDDVVAKLLIQFPPLLKQGNP
ncbi:MAG: DUF4136 domain-containing protein [Chlorobiaceae bacterium]|nr:DUF4136 domain-containing protein [Chlorobiaceae bacterium]